jgi:hypothetical protein
MTTPRRHAARAAICLALAIGGAAPVASSRPAAAPLQPAPTLRILFIGNSLTSTYDVPSMVQAIAQSGTRREVHVEAAAFPDFGLQQHWEDGRARRLIRRRGWTHVVLQQGPSSLADSRRILHDYAGRFVEEIRAAGARPVFYSVWPARDRLAFFDAVTESYRSAAALTGGALAAAGEAWRLAWREDPLLPLYGADGFHPSPLGAYLAALVITQTITGDDETAGRPLIAATPAHLRIVQDAARRVRTLQRP